MSLEAGRTFSSWDEPLNMIAQINKVLKKEVKLNRTTHRGRLEVVCFNAPCTFKVTGSYSTKHDHHKLIQCNINHSCTGDKRRKRVIGHEKMGFKDSSVVMKTFAPSGPAKKGKISDAKQFVEMVNNENCGFSLSYNQGWVICNEGSVLSVHQAVYEYSILESVLDAFQKSDVGGKFLIRKSEIVLNQEEIYQLKDCYIRPSVTFRFWDRCHRKIVCVDGTFLTGPLKGCILTAVTKDSNNHLMPLAFGQVHSETKDSWVWFVRHLQEDFPDIEVIFCFLVWLFV